MKTLLITLLLSLFAFGESCSQPECFSPDYEWDRGFIKLRYKRSIFIVKDRLGNGTGFMVDADKGLLITAKHVIADPSTAMAFNPFVNNGKHYKVKVIWEDAARDICLIQINDLQTFLKYKGHINELDISLNGLSAPKYYSLSFPDSTATDLTLQEVKIMRFVAGAVNAYEIQMTAREGMSGSPLIDTRGRVVAYAKAQHSDATSGYFRTFAARDSLYTHLKANETARSFLKSLQVGPVDMDEFFFALDNDPSKTQIRNIDILNVYNQSQNKFITSYDSSIVPYFDCIRSCLADRGLAKLSINVAIYNKQAPSVFDYVLLARKASAKNNKGAAVALCDVAKTLVISKMSTLLNVGNSTILEQVEQNGAAFQNYSLSGKSATVKTSLALLLNDYAYIDFFSGNNQDAIKFAEKSATLADDPQVKMNSYIIMQGAFQNLKDQEGVRTSRRRVADLKAQTGAVANLSQLSDPKQYEKVRATPMAAIF
jgi:hypothetical protein